MFRNRHCSIMVMLTRMLMWTVVMMTHDDDDELKGDM